MVLNVNRFQFLFLITLSLLFTTSTLAQTKKVKRPKSSVGVISIDSFVSESFDVYDKVYTYNGHAKADIPLEDSDIDVLEQALEDLEGISEHAPDIISDFEGLTMLRQAKATLQMNKAKKALKFSIKISKELLLNNRKQDSTNNNN